MAELTKETLLNRVKIDKKTNCWNYTMYKDKRGYGRTTYKNKTWLLHRLSYYLFRGKFKKDKYICHKCDNTSCINPDHLFVGTQKDNMQDMISKGRDGFGENHPCAKLNEKQVKDIRKKIKFGLSLREIAKQYDVNFTSIRSIKHYRAWKYI